MIQTNSFGWGGGGRNNTLSTISLFKKLLVEQWYDEIYKSSAADEAVLNNIHKKRKKMIFLLRGRICTAYTLTFEVFKVYLGYMCRWYFCIYRCVLVYTVLVSIFWKTFGTHLFFWSYQVAIYLLLLNYVSVRIFFLYCFFDGILVKKCKSRNH
jgi:hypothetical protein